MSDSFFNQISQAGTASVSSARPVSGLDAVVDSDLLLQLASENKSPLTAAEAFWVQNDIDSARWNQLRPYQLLIVRAVAAADGTTSHQIEPGYQFTLPVSPESLSVSDQIAITVSATQGGIIEEHNGAPFKLLSIRGSTGVLPGRGSAAQQLGFSLFETIAGGTVQQLNIVKQDVATAFSAFSNTALTNPNIHPNADFDPNNSNVDNARVGDPSIVAKTTGWYQFQKLQRFLESYYAVKKTKAGRDLRLAFCMWKDQSIYLVTPVSFSATRSAISPLETTYDLSLKAWRRINLDTSSFNTVLGTALRRDPNKLARVLNTIQAVRQVLQSASRIAPAIIGDIDRLVFEPLREIALAAKDAQGLALSLAEMPAAIQKEAYASWVQLQGTSTGRRNAANQTNDTVKRQLQAGGSIANETNDIVSSRMGPDLKRQQSTHPAFQPFSQNSQSVQLMLQADISSLKLPPRVTQQIESERIRVSNFKRVNYEANRNNVRQAADALAFALGAGNSTYQTTYQTNIKQVKATPTESDWEALYALNEAAAALDAFAATGDSEPTSLDNNMVLMSTLARRSGVAFQIPTSKYAVPFPYGSTLESLAQKYLNDANRWMEIATLNGLRQPYIDEVGFDIYLLANGSGNEVVIPYTDDTKNNLYIGQQVFIGSNTTLRTQRRINAIKVTDSYITIGVDGDPTMGSYTLASNGKLSAFLPDTVNSQSLIYIPSDRQPADTDFVTKSIPTIDVFDPLTAAGGVDLLLTDTNDLIITPDGDTRLSAGLTNIIQNIRIALSVTRGTLLQHPNFGIPFRVGMSTADLDVNEALAAVKRMFAEEPAFSSVDGVKVTKSGVTASISAQISLVGVKQPVPVSYNIQT